MAPFRAASPADQPLSFHAYGPGSASTAPRQVSYSYGAQRMAVVAVRRRHDALAIGPPSGKCRCGWFNARRSPIRHSRLRPGCLRPATRRGMLDMRFRATARLGRSQSIDVGRGYLSSPRYGCLGSAPFTDDRPCCVGPQVGWIPSRRSEPGVHRP
jgi:hypothetical protein